MEEDQMKRFVGLLGSVVILASACGTATPSAAPSAGPTGAAETPAASAAAPVKLTVWARNYTLDQPEPWQAPKQAFEAKHPGVTVELSGAPYDPQYSRITLAQ